MKKEIYIVMIGIVIGEFLILYGNIYQGVGVHIINILAIIICIIIGNFSLETKNTLQSLTLLSILRIINVSVPQFFTNVYLQYLSMYGIMFIPMFLIIKNQWMTYKELDNSLYSGRVYVHMSIVILTVIIIKIIGQYFDIIPNIQTFATDTNDVIGIFISIFLIIILSISFLISDTKYWNRYILSTLNIYTYPLLLIFAMIVIHKIVSII